jgi:hypothetical protein
MLQACKICYQFSIVLVFQIACFSDVGEIEPRFQWECLGVRVCVYVCEREREWHESNHCDME